jgi:hypothetical protein
MFENYAPHVTWGIILKKTANKAWRFRHCNHDFEIARNEKRIQVIIDGQVRLITCSPTLLFASAIQYCDFVTYGGDLSEVIVNGKPVTERRACLELFKLIPRPREKLMRSQTAQADFVTSVLSNRLYHLPLEATLCRDIGKTKVTIVRKTKYFVIESDTGLRFRLRNDDRWHCDMLAKACYEATVGRVEDVIIYSSSTSVRADGVWSKMQIHAKNVPTLALCVVNGENPLLAAMMGHYNKQNETSTQ